MALSNPPDVIPEDLGPEARLSYQESMGLIELPPIPNPQGNGSVRRFMSATPAYVATSDYPRSGDLPRLHSSTFGGHVYAQAGRAAYLVWRDTEDKNGVTDPYDRLGLHTIHGYFTLAGKADRPFIYHVTPLTSIRNLATLSVTAHQPTTPSTHPDPSPPNRFTFPPSDADLPLSPPCFTALVSLKIPESHSSAVNTQEPSPQSRFSAILSSRRASEWPPSPIADISGILQFVDQSHIGLFPMVDMKKVDIAEWNADRPVHERRELILYRLLKPLPSDGEGGLDANDHVLVHAYAADRNGLLMVGNHNGIGSKFGKAATISNSFVVHVNVEEAVMRYEEDGGEEEEWWVQEVCFPRAGAGRGIVMNKIWSPRGVHVATEYQDGVVRSDERSERLGSGSGSKL